MTALPLADNPAVSNPMKALTPRQREALAALDFFATNFVHKGICHVGNKRFGPSVITRLRAFHLIRQPGRSLTITQAGKLALEKLKGKQ